MKGNTKLERCVCAHMDVCRINYSWMPLKPLRYVKLESLHYTLTHSCLKISLTSVFYIYDTFENNLGVKIASIKYLKDFSVGGSNQHFSFIYLRKMFYLQRYRQQNSYVIYGCRGINVFSLKSIKQRKPLTWIMIKVNFGQELDRNSENRLFSRYDWI